MTKTIRVKAQRIGGTQMGLSESGKYVLMTMDEARKNGVLRKITTEYTPYDSVKIARLWHGYFSEVRES